MALPPHNYYVATIYSSLSLLVNGQKKEVKFVAFPLEKRTCINETIKINYTRK